MPRQSESTAILAVETVEQPSRLKAASLRYRQREEDVLKKHVLLRNTELPEGANPFMRELAGKLIANCASLLHTKIKDKKTTSGYFGGATHGYNLAAIEVVQPGLGVFLDSIAKRWGDSHYTTMSRGISASFGFRSLSRTASLTSQCDSMALAEPM
jgi:hypothetical protein